jgi:hypothetical protein
VSQFASLAGKAHSLLWRESQHVLLVLRASSPAVSTKPTVWAVILDDTQLQVQEAAFIVRWAFFPPTLTLRDVKSALRRPQPELKAHQRLQCAFALLAIMAKVIQG